MIEPLCFWGEPSGDGRIHLPVVGPIIFAASCSTVAAIFGGRTFSPKLGYFTIYVLAGIIAGILLGATVVPAVLTACNPMGFDAFSSKVFGGFQRLCILGGIPVGALLGLTFFAIRYRHRYATDHTDEREPE
ncbi:hypothetical protein [Calycomorphotria hydatis]|uniref:hypothetical protein n=1 Tax=Calycomorphotria hydatis TaxID=2528027 RepID=UPI00119D06FF|nr:hypothetical protein [Calycomorphotria hydatis]